MIMNQVNSVRIAANSYNDLLSQKNRIEIHFYIVFVLINLLILFIAILIGLAFADNLINPITNLINTSNLIKKGNLKAKVPQINTKDEMSLLIKRFNEMTSTLGKQRTELGKRERNSAWSDIARRIAHEIKNPLTPIQLSAEFLKKNSKSSEYRNYASIIVKQVSSIEKMVDEFSKFARLPKPIFNKCDLNLICSELFLLHKKANPMIDFSIKSNSQKIYCNVDGSQISMAINNLIKNSIESINQKYIKKAYIYTIIIINDYAFLMQFFWYIYDFLISVGIPTDRSIAIPTDIPHAGSMRDNEANRSIGRYTDRY